MLSRSYWLVRERSVRSVEDAVALLATDSRVCKDMIVDFISSGCYAADDLAFHLGRVVAVDCGESFISLRSRHYSLRDILGPLFLHEAYEAIGQVLADTEFSVFPPYDRTDEWESMKEAA